MMTSESHDRAYQFFIEEARELLETIEAGLLTLREDRSTLKIHEIMRAAHSLKGGAASVELNALKDISHRLEDFFRALYNESLELDAGLEILLLQGFDCLKNPLQEQIERGFHDPEAALKNAEPIFERLRERLGAAMTDEGDFLPSMADLGVDLTASIFEVDVSRQLESLRANPSGEELSTTIEIFAGLAEMLDLPGFAAIGTTVKEQLDRGIPVETLIPLALENWENARAGVLNGDRSLPVLSLSKPDEEDTESDFARQAYQFFIEEAIELLETIGNGLNSLAAEPTTNRVHELMRAAHSIKGGAASVGLETIRSLAYSLENYFKALFHPRFNGSGTVLLTPELENAFQEAFECLKLPLLFQIERGEEKDGAVENSIPVFERLEALLGESLHQTEEYIPGSADLGYDIVASLFEVDVKENLDTLEIAVRDSEPTLLIGTLKTTLEVFEGFAQMLSLSGFADICRTTNLALHHHPEQVKEIARLAIQDFRLAREQVLEGDRTIGGTTSAELSLLAFPAPSEPVLETTTIEERIDIFDLELEMPTTSPLEEILGVESLNGEVIPEMPKDTALEAVFGAGIIGEEESTFNFEPAEIEKPTPDGGDFFMPSWNDLFEVVQDEGEIEPAAEIPPSLDEVFGTGTPIVEEESVNTELPIESETEPSIQDRLDADLADISREILEDFQDLPKLDRPLKNTVNPIFYGSKERDTTKKRSEKAAKGTAAPSGLSVRVDFNRLERMNNLVGELAINRNSLSLQNEQLQSAVRELLNRFGRFEKMTDNIREISDRMLIADFGAPKAQDSTPTLETDIGFDSLEMDRYGKLHSSLQEMLEEMMQLSESVDDIVLFARGSNQTIEAQRQMLTNLRDELMWARMLPLGEVLNRFPRLLRDLSNSHGKPVRLKLSGTGVLVDRSAIEKLYDPLLHLVRNAFDHGIETPETRRANGKPEEGTIEIQAYHQGNQTVIEIKDDGNGLNFDKIRAKALKMGLISEEQLSSLSTEKLAELIFEPGFSTAAKVSELSGRGVGLDVVREQLRGLKGSVTVTSEPGRGTVFSLRLPLTLTIAKLLVCTFNTDKDSATAAVALPSDGIEEIVIPRAEQLKRSGQQRFLHFAGKILPLYSLGSLLDYRCPLPANFSSKALTSAVPSPDDWHSPLLILRRGQQMYAVEVNRLVTEMELVIKPFGGAIAPPPYTYGCTILGDGTLLPVINGSLLLEYCLDRESESGMELGSIDVPRTPSRTATPTILVVDDSTALRRTLALTLEKSGYRVLQARDGREALEQLHANVGVNLVICDVEMPNMNGFEFLGQRRQENNLLKIPVAMLTSRSSDKHRQLATHLGANAYFTKPYIEQQFLTSVRSLIEDSRLVHH